MFEKVNPSHPDKVADRIAGAIVDLAYAKEDNPRIAVEVLIGHGKCHIISETSVNIDGKDVEAAVKRIAGDVEVDYQECLQDFHLAKNQEGMMRCGDNGIFKGTPVTDEQKRLARIMEHLYGIWPHDGKAVVEGRSITICQSHADESDIRSECYGYYDCTANPLGSWTGGINVDTGATNRKLGSDMGDSVTGGGLHGKDLSKADVSVNIWCFTQAQRTGCPVEMSCSIGDEYVDGIPYSVMVENARVFIRELGGFEKFAEWGLIR